MHSKDNVRRAASLMTKEKIIWSLEYTWHRLSSNISLCSVDKVGGGATLQQLHQLGAKNTRGACVFSHWEVVISGERFFWEATLRFLLTQSKSNWLVGSSSFVVVLEKNVNHPVNTREGLKRHLTHPPSACHNCCVTFLSRCNPSVWLWNSL